MNEITDASCKIPGNQPRWTPSPEEIRRECAKIRATWSLLERQRRQSAPIGDIEQAQTRVATYTASSSSLSMS